MKREEEIGSDHFLLEVKMRVNAEKDLNAHRRKREFLNIRSYKLQQTTVQQEYQEDCDRLFTAISEHEEEEDLETMWKTFSETIIRAYTNNKKLAAWWNDDIKAIVKKDQLEKMEMRGQGSCKSSYRTLKNLRNKDNSAHKFINSKGGKKLTKPEEIQENWYEYFSDLLERRNRDADLSIDEANTRVDINEEENMEYEKVARVISRLKNG
ncbi:hypothetical protein ILUMI_09272 [Ignelater luminosus]|uniref:Uncharacterized protein n=1 Tax=Ignelater luminosus TaxID=2038154 RepID=A0A8K0D027_IGNLU|nr:hypothetical protein ILUMI_09272 [Ignelater luminosus]